MATSDGTSALAGGDYITPEPKNRTQNVGFGGGWGGLATAGVTALAGLATGNDYMVGAAAGAGKSFTDSYNMLNESITEEDRIQRLNDAQLARNKDMARYERDLTEPDRIQAQENLDRGYRLDERGVDIQDRDSKSMGALRTIQGDAAKHGMTMATNADNRAHQKLTADLNVLKAQLATETSTQEKLKQERKLKEHEIRLIEDQDYAKQYLERKLELENIAADATQAQTKEKQNELILEYDSFLEDMVASDTYKDKLRSQFRLNVMLGKGIGGSKTKKSSSDSGDAALLGTSFGGGGQHIELNKQDWDSLANSAADRAELEPGVQKLRAKGDNKGALARKDQLVEIEMKSLAKNIQEMNSQYGDAGGYDYATDPAGGGGTKASESHTGVPMKDFKRIVMDLKRGRVTPDQIRRQVTSQSGDEKGMRQAEEMIAAAGLTEENYIGTRSPQEQSSAASNAIEAEKRGRRTFMQDSPFVKK